MPSTVEKFPSQRGKKDAFAEFFEDPSRESFRQLMKEQLGESRSVEFKQEWLPPDVLAKNILGFSNTGPGCLVFGVAEREDTTLEPAGLAKFKDKADVQNQLRKYLPQHLMEQVLTWDFEFDSSEYEKVQGKKFQVLIVEHRPEYMPYLPLKSSPELKNTAIYCRRDGQTVEATYEELQEIVNNRIETGYSTKNELSMKIHLEQLKALYDELPATFDAIPLYSSLFLQKLDKNGKTYDATLRDFIQIKKEKIENFIRNTK